MAILVVAWLIVTAVPIVQTDRSLDAERADSASARLATDVADGVPASQLLVGFRATTEQTPIATGIRVLGHRYAATELSEA